MGDGKKREDGGCLASRHLSPEARVFQIISGFGRHDLNPLLFPTIPAGQRKETNSGSLYPDFSLRGKGTTAID